MDLVIFDLDGTLIDSSVDLANSVNATRAHLDLPPIDNEVVYSYVGNGAPVLIRTDAHRSATQTYTPGQLIRRGRHASAP